MESVSEDERKLSTSEKLHFKLLNILQNKQNKNLKLLTYFIILKKH